MIFNIAVRRDASRYEARKRRSSEISATLPVREASMRRRMTGAMLRKAELRCAVTQEIIMPSDLAVRERKRVTGAAGSGAFEVTPRVQQ